MLNWLIEPGLRVHPMGMPNGYYGGFGGPLSIYLWSIQALPAGGYRAYGTCFYSTPLNEDDGTNLCVSLISPDGRNWVGEPGFRIGVQPAPYDANTIFPVPQFLLGEGIRLFFATIKYYVYHYGPPANPESDYVMQSGCSPDGRNFVTEPGIRTPSAVNNGIDSRSMPSSLVQEDNFLRMYQVSRVLMYSGDEYMKSTISPDGLNWSQEPGKRTEGYQSYSTTYYGRVFKNNYGVYRMGMGGVGVNGADSGSSLSAQSPNGLNFCVEPGSRASYSWPNNYFPTGMRVPVLSGSRSYAMGASAIASHDLDEVQEFKEPV